MQQFLLIGLITSWGLLTLTVIYAYYLQKKEKGLKNIEAKAYEKAQNILKEIHISSQKMLEETLQKSKEMLNQTQDFKTYLEENTKRAIEETIKTYQDTLNKNAQEVAESYTDLFLTLKEKYLQETENVFKELQSTAGKGIVDFKTAIQNNTTLMQNEIKKFSLEEYQKIRKELEAYKEEEIKKVSSQISKIIFKTAQELLGKTIPIADHEKLVLEALEKAKKEGVFEIE